MNDKLIKVGKATLATVMATSVSMNSLTSLPIFAEENLESPQEEVPVETPAMEESTEVIEEQPVVEEEPGIEEEPVAEENATIFERVPVLDGSKENLALAQGVHVTANGSENEDVSRQPSNVVDNQADSRWASRFGDQNPWIQLDLGTAKTFNRIHVYWESGKANAYTIEVSDDQTSWRPVFTSNTHPVTVDDVIQFEETTARYIRIKVNGVSQKDPLNQVDDYTIISIYEIQVFHDVKQDTSRQDLEALYEKYQYRNWSFIPKNYLSGWNSIKSEVKTVLKENKESNEKIREILERFKLEIQRYSLKNTAAQYLLKGHISGPNEFGSFDAQYPKYTTDSCIALVHAADSGWVLAASSQDIDALKAKEDAIKQAANSLVVYDPVQGGAYGIPEYRNACPCGTMRVQSVLSKDTVRITLTFVNDGRHPYTSAVNETKKFSGESMETATFHYTYTDSSGKTSSKSVNMETRKALNGDYREGLEASFEVDASLISGTFSFRMMARDRYGKSVSYKMPGLYQLAVALPEVNKANLKTVVEYAKEQIDSSNSAYDKATITAQKNYKKAYEAAKKVYEDPRATQAEVDAQYTALSDAGHKLLANERASYYEVKEAIEKIKKYNNLFGDGSNYQNGEKYLEAYNAYKEEVYDSEGKVKEDDVVKAFLASAENKLNVEIVQLKAKEPKLTVSIKGKEYALMNLEGIILQAVLRDEILYPNDKYDLNFVRGTITKDDLRYIDEDLNKITSLTMNLNADLTYEDGTKIPNKLLEGKGELTSVSLNGWTVLGEMSLYRTDKLKQFTANDVEVVEYDAFGSTGLERLSLPKAKSLGDNSFYNAEILNSIEIPLIETIGNQSFYGCKKLENITFGKNVKDIQGIRLGYYEYQDLNVTFLAPTAPEMSKNTFETKKSEQTLSVTVPAAGIQSYYGEKVNNTAIFKQSDVQEMFRDWNIHVIDHSTVKYVVGNEETLAFVGKDETITKNRMPVVKAGVNEKFVGWSEAQDGSGTLYIESSKVAKDLTLYPVFKEAIAPNVEVSYSNNGALTKDKVTVTLKADEAIKELEGWTKVNETTYTKEFDANTTLDVVVEDLAGNTTKVIVNVVNIDKEAPVLQVKNAEIVIEEGEAFDPLTNVTVTDNRDPNIVVTYTIKEGADVDIKKPGEYTIVYHAVDAAGNEARASSLLIVNPKGMLINKAPTIQAKDVTIVVGSAFDPLKGVTAMDAEDGDLTSKISCKSNVDRNKVGVYKVTYTVMDSQGATTSKTIQVTVEKKAVTPGNKPNDKKDPEKGNGTNTSMKTNAKLFTSLGVSAMTLAGILAILKKKRK